MVEFKKLPYKKDEVWICSDLHYAHQDIVRPLTTWQREIEDLDFDCRQFNSLEEMNDQIVNRLNEKVSEEHLLIIVGDIAFGGIQRLYELRGRINCRNVYIVQGNHDHLFDRKPEIRDIFQRYDTIGYYQVEEILAYSENIENK
jgi:calcineurin-like phosphoesterase family protein